MLAFAEHVCQQLPLAEAVLRLFAYLADDTFLDDLFERYRGRSYEKVIAFPLFVQLIADALLEHDGSGRQSFQRAQEAGDLQASLKAAYGKLARVPQALSAGLLAEATDRLRAVFPVTPTDLPASLDGLDVLFLDGKAIKHVAKRLRALQKVRGHLLGGKLAVALDWRTGLAVALASDPDGEASDVPLAPGVVAQVRARGGRPRLWVADRLYCDLNVAALLSAGGDHFLIRHNRRLSFQRDESRPVRQGTDARGRAYQEEWGWAGRAADPRRRYLRRIVLARPGEEDVALLTDLLDADAYPATELLEAYLQRWGIERMFQKVTEVFHLRRLIGGTPEATVFQASFCFLLYNLVMVIRGYVAAAQGREPETISAEQVFHDVQRQLIAWNEVLSPPATVALLRVPWTAAALGRHLQQRLRAVWHAYWLKAPKKKYVPKKKAKQYQMGGHNSVYRLLRGAAPTPAPSG